MKPRLTTLKLPSARRSLLRLHQDLFSVINSAPCYVPEGPLDDLEILVLVLEDRRFFSHLGIDYRSLVREVWKALTLRKHGGASTIDMQLVRTATGYKDRTLRRKLYEMLLAWLLNFKYRKIQILRLYLDRAYFGTGLIGIYRASDVLSGKRPDELKFDEKALLAAMLVYPRPRLPTAQWSLNVRRRADYGKALFGVYEERFKKLPRREVV